MCRHGVGMRTRGRVVGVRDAEGGRPTSRPSTRDSERVSLCHLGLKCAHLPHGSLSRSCADAPACETEQGFPGRESALACQLAPSWRPSWCRSSACHRWLSTWWIKRAAFDFWFTQWPWPSPWPYLLPGKRVGLGLGLGCVADCLLRPPSPLTWHARC